MCNDYRLEVEIASILEDFDDLEINIETPEGIPNVEPRADINITDMAPIVRTAEAGGGAGELVNRRWSWPGRAKPVYNFQAEERTFQSHRCLILADGFYEFTTPEDKKQKRKNKFLFTLEGHRWFCIAGIWRAHPEVGEAFTMLTLPASEDIAPYADRQIIPLPRDRWAAWLDPAVPASDVLQPLPSGSFAIEQVYPPREGDAEQPALLPAT